MPAKKLPSRSQSNVPPAWVLDALSKDPELLQQVVLLVRKERAHYRRSTKRATRETVAAVIDAFSDIADRDRADGGNRILGEDSTLRTLFESCDLAMWSREALHALFAALVEHARPEDLEELARVAHQELRTLDRIAEELAADEARAS